MKKVLLIDDDPITNFINTKLIENTGLADEIVIAETAKQGLEILINKRSNQQAYPDLILLDINMPLINGFEFLRNLYGLGHSDIDCIKIAILSSSDNIEDKVKAKQLGINYYFVKPITVEALRLILA